MKTVEKGRSIVYLIEMQFIFHPFGNNHWALAKISITGINFFHIATIEIDRIDRLPTIHLQRIDANKLAISTAHMYTFFDAIIDQTTRSLQIIQQTKPRTGRWCKIDSSDFDTFPMPMRCNPFR